MSASSSPTSAVSSPHRPARAPARRTFARLSAALIAAGALVASGCGGSEDADATPKSLVEGGCVVDRGSDASGDRLTPADCNGPHDARITRAIGPRQALTECPAGTDRQVKQWMESPELRQEMLYCLDTPAPTADLPATADVSKVRTFDDPASRLAEPKDLADYLLPGLRGAGVTCATNQLQLGEITGVDPEAGAVKAASVVATCFDGASVGRLLTMYAYGLDGDAAARAAYDRRIDCIEPAVAALGEDAQREALTAVFSIRLDLTAPIGSPSVAAQQISTRTDC